MTMTHWMKPVNLILVTAWNVTKYGVFSGPYFPAFGLNTERYRVTPYSNTFHGVSILSK